jgi:type II secretory pathway pseudopilin PulG
MRLIARRHERGDTIIEVLFAVTVFAMVAVGAMTIMNQGTATAQRSLEVTLVRQQIDAQAEAIRYIHQAYVSAYPMWQLARLSNGRR